ncbi:GDP-6-deoxy-D-lyxo-4-hexulose reductase [Zymomonas mobilis subsp. pomaceae]|nr:GDP-6-deoxy-D-lyxo-4-hexulose reductase [Zymomonas mobilis subsp. pomaceae]
MITGGNGFVGRYLIEALSHSAPDAILYTNRIEITDPAVVSQAVIDFQPDACIHLAGITSIGEARQNPDLAWNVNLHGTLNIGRAILQWAPACRLIYASTAEAWGTSFRQGTPVDENVPLAPANTYAASKAAADLALGAMAEEGLQVIRFRPFNHTGPGQDIKFVVPAFASQIIQIERGLQPPVIYVGNLSAERDFLDVRDVVSAYVQATLLGDTIKPGTIVPLCSGQTRSISSILNELILLSGVTARIEVDKERLRPIDIPVATGSARLAHSTLGWAPTIPWTTTLSDILQYFRTLDK